MYLGALATAAVADMPVGTLPPLASALEPRFRRHATKRGNKAPLINPARIAELFVHSKPIPPEDLA